MELDIKYFVTVESSNVSVLNSSYAYFVAHISKILLLTRGNCQFLIVSKRLYTT